MSQVHPVRSIADGKPTIPVRGESRLHTVSENSSVVSKWLDAASAADERSLSIDRIEKDQALTSAMKHLPLAPCCQETKSNVEHHIGHRVAETVAMLETSFDRLIEKLDNMEERICRIEASHRVSRRLVAMMEDKANGSQHSHRHGS